MKNHKHCLFVSIITILAIVFIIGCNSGGKKLSGIWEEDSNDEYTLNIKFDGRKFIVTEYPVCEWAISSGGRAYANQLLEMGIKNVEFVSGFLIYQDLYLYAPFHKGSELYKKVPFKKYSKPFDGGYLTPITEELIDELNLTLIESFDPYPLGSWAGDLLDGRKNQRYRIEIKGTYSITDDEIEFLFQNGTIEVYPFTRTENTIMINGDRYTRKSSN